LRHHWSPSCKRTCSLPFHPRHRPLRFRPDTQMAHPCALRCWCRRRRYQHDFVSFLSTLSPANTDLFSLLSSIIVGDLFSLKQRGSIGAMATAIRAVGAALGGPVGGLLSDLFGWRAAFVGQVGSSFVSTYSKLTPFDHRFLSSSTASTRVFTRRAT
jgi:hypothetical protein